MSITNNNSNQIRNSSVATKYGDADVCSKRRKLPPTIHEEEDVEIEDQLVSNDVDLDYQHFENTAIDCCINSSFQDNSIATLQCLESSTQSLQTETSAKKDVNVTQKPSLSSKGFENTFKLLQNHVQHNNQKTISVMQSISAERSAEAFGIDNFLLSVVDREPPTRLELELEATQRIQTLLNDNKSELTSKQHGHGYVSKTLLTLLYDFAVKGQTSAAVVLDEKKSQQINLLREIVGAHPELIYHASKGANGKHCLKVVRHTGVLCGNRVSQMTRTYDDIEAVTRLLEEKEKDLELTVQIGKELLTQNTTLENRINDLQADLKVTNDDRTQLLHELHKKNELIAVLTNDADDNSENDTPTFSKSITLDLLQKRVVTLQEENKSLKVEASQLANETDAVEEHERQLMADIASQLNEANSQFDNLSLELERQREENRLQHEQVVSLTARLSEAEMRLHQLTHDNDEHVSLLNITKENQNSLALELVEFKQRYNEVLALLSEAQEQLRKQRKKAMPQARSSFVSNMGYLQPESLQSELMETSLYSESSMDSGISVESQRINDRIGRVMSQVPGGSVNGGVGGLSQPYKRIFETVRCASKSGNYGDSSSISMSQIGAMSMSSSSGPRMSASAYGSNSHPAGSFYRNSGYESYSMGGKTLSCESVDMQSDDGYPAQASGVPGAPGAKDLEAALKRLTPAEVLARRAMLSFAPIGTYNYDEQPPAALPLGIRTPESIMSTGSSGMSSSQTWRLPDKLQIVKPIEGSQTLHHWSQLATPTLSGLLEERPGVTIRGGRGLEDLGLQMYTLSDVEEDVSEELPGKQFEAPGCTFTYTTSVVMHPDDGLVNDLSFLSQSQMSSRMASASTSRQPSCPATPRAGLSRKNSCSTFSVNLGLASMLNERGIKAVTPSALNTPAGPNFSPTVTPCNSPEGSPTRSNSPEPLFGLLSSGADMIMRKLVGVDMDRPNRNQQKQQKIMLSRLERRALRSLKLVEKVESIGLENIISMQPSASGIASRSSSPMAQLTSLKHLHTSANSMVDDIQFDRDQIKGVLHKGLKNSMPSTARTIKPCTYNSDWEESTDLSHSEMHKNLQTSAPVPITTTNQPEVVDAQSCTSINTTQSSQSISDARTKQMQRQKSRRNLKNGMAAQRPDLGTIGGRVRTDLGKVSSSSSSSIMKTEQTAAIGKLDQNAEKKATPDTSAPREPPQSFTQSFVGSMSSLLFGRKGGWL